MLARLWRILKSTARGYTANNALSRGAAIAYYTVFSLAPVLVIIIAVAGLVFGEEAARGAIVGQISGLMGEQGAEAIQEMIKGASGQKKGILATVIGIAALIVTASGVFSEMQAALNAVWKVQSRHGTVGALVRARLSSLGLVMTLGFLLLVSLVVSAALASLKGWLNAFVPGLELVMFAVNLVISLGLITLLFAAIYKVLPDQLLSWRDVLVGSFATAVLFAVGRSAISLYIGSSSVASGYGAAGALAVVFVWIYYSSQIFLFGAEFTRAYAEERGSPAGLAAAEATRKLKAAQDEAARLTAEAAGIPSPDGKISHAGELEKLKGTLDTVRR